MRIATNIAIVNSAYWSHPIAQYTCCPHCGGNIHRYPRACHPHGHRLYGRCLDCNYGAWDWEESEAITARLEAIEREQVAA